MIIATLTKVEGNVFVKKIDGSIVKLSVGDTLETGDIVFGADSSAAYSVKYTDNGGSMNYAGTAPQMFDPTMIPTQIQGAESAVEVASVNPFAQSILTSEELAALINEEDKENEGKKDTAAGQEEVKQGEGQGDDFADRTGAQTDVNSGLRNAKFVSSIAREEEQELFKREDSGKLDPIDPLQPTLPPVEPPLPPITPPPVIDPPVITPPPLRGTLDLNGDTSVSEGGVATYTLRVSEGPKTPLVVTIQIGHITTEDGDLIPRTITVTIPVGATSVTFPVSNNTDTVYEGPEDYRVSIVSTSGGNYNQLTIGNDTVTTTINDAQAKPTLVINDQTINEQEGTMTFTVTLSGTTEADVTFDYASVNDSATSVTDYTAVSGIGTIGAGQLTTTITVSIHDDYMSDNNETFNIILSNPSSNAVIADSTGVGTILDDSGTPNTIDGTDIEANHEIVQIKLIALNQDGTPVLDGSGHYTFANTVNEGSSAKYMALAFAPGESVFSPATKLVTQAGSVNVAFTNGTATGAATQTTSDGTQDYDNDTQVAVSLGTVINVATFNDNLPDNNEIFTVRMVSGTYLPLVGGYENVTLDVAPVTTTIDDSLALAPDTATVAEGGVTITNASVGMVNLLANDTYGIGSVIETFGYYNEANVLSSAVAGTTVDTKYGQLQINADGTWSYTSDGNETHPVGNTLSDLVTYTVKDGSNTQASSFTITVTDTVPTLGSVTTVYVDEDDLLSGSSPSSVGLSVEASLAITAGSDTFDTIFTVAEGAVTGLTSNGAQVYYYLSSDLKTLTASTSSTEGSVSVGNTVFTDTLTSTTSSGAKHTFVLTGVIDHPSANAQNTQTLGFTYRVTDNDGDSVNGSFNVGIVDDVPTAVNDDDISLAEGGDVVTSTGADAAHANLLTNDTLGADGASVTSITYRNEANTLDVTVAVPAGATGVTVDTINGSLTVKADGSWSFTSDPSVTNPSGSDATDTFTYVITDRDGDTSSATKTFNISDGANPTIAPDSLVVSEATLGTGSSLVSFTTTGDLNVVKGSDNIADTKFTDATKTALEAMGIKSGGADLFYTLSADKHTITATKTNGSGAEVFVVTITNPASVNAKYDFKLSLPLDHTKLTNDTEWILPFNVYTVDTDDNNIVDNNDDASGSFTVTVQDSTPSATDVTKTINEDEATEATRTLRISQDAFSDGTTTGSIVLNNGVDGDQTVAIGGYVNVYDADHNDIIGRLYNPLGDGTLRFDPYTNYSDDASDSSVVYKVYDTDGDYATQTITLSVTPVADKPLWDNNGSGIQTSADNINVSTSEDTIVALGLKMPTITDNTDQNGAGTTGDHPERLGYITLESIDAGVKIYKGDGTTLLFTGANTTMTIAIVDGSGNLDTTVHHTDLNPNAVGVIKLTAAEFEALQVLPSLNKHNDIDMTLKVTSYEVDDSGNKLPSPNNTGATSDNLSVHVEVSAVTDPIALAFDNNMGLGTISGAGNDTFTYTATANEGMAAINLQSLMSPTSGNSVDLDGSEQRSYTVSGIPEGTIINLGGTTATANASGIATVNFSNASELLNDPTFTMTLPTQYSGTVNATIVLSVYDQDADSTSINAGLLASPLTQTVYFNIDVAPVADTVTVAIKQSFGLEDAGRLADGTTTVSSAANGINLDVKITSVDSSETYTLNLSDIPDGAQIYYDGILITPSSGIVNPNIIATNTVGSTWSVEIKEFTNTVPFKYIPVLSSNEDVTLKAIANSVDATSTSTSIGAVSTILDVNVIVTGVADIPTHNATNSITITDTASASHTYQAIVTEDTPSIALNTLFAASTPNFSSFDISGLDGSESLFVTVTGVPDGFGITGATSLGGSGTSREWQVALADFNSANLTVPSNYSGEVTFKIQLQTVENDGNKSTLLDIPLKVLITPEAEGMVNNSASQNEDELKTLSFAFNNGGDTNEALTSLEIDTSSLSLVGVHLYKNGTEITSTGWVSVNTATDVITARTPADLDTDYTFALRYSVSDTTTDGSHYTDVTQGSGYNATTPNIVNATYTVTVNPVTDTTTFTLDTFTDIDGDGTTDVSYVSGTRTVTVTDNTIFQVPLRLTADNMVGESSNGQDLDSEIIQTRVTISGVPQGVIVVGGTYLGDTDGGNTGLWRVDITDDLIIDNATGEINNISFEVGESTYANINQLVTLSISHKDGSGATLTNTQTFTLVLDGTTFGAGGIGSGGTTNTNPVDLTLVTTGGVNFVEDTAKALGDFVTLGDSTTLLDTGKYAITITNVVGGSISGMELVNGFYTYQGTGTVADITDLLNSGAISITPTGNANINTPANVTFDMTITTYGSNAQNTYSIPVVSPIAPVSDATSISISGNGAHANEDTNAANFETITIDLNNLADNGRVIITGNTVSIKLAETVIDGAIGGVVTDSFGNTLVVDGTTWNTFTVSDMDTNIVLKYYPQANLYGSLSVTAKVETQEDPLTSGYTTSPVTTETTQIITIAPVNNGISAAPTIVGDEDGIALLNFAGATLSDTTEHISSAKLSGVPFGYEVTLNGVVQTGTVIGKNVAGDYLYEYNFSSITSVAQLETIGVKRIGITNFSGEVSGVTLSVTSGETGIETAATWPITIKFNPVADALLNMTVTKTFGSEYTWVPVNINANVRDVDGSETLRVILVGAATALDATAQFRLADGTLIPSTGAMNATFSGGTWTIDGIAYNQINNLQMQYHEYSGNINVTVKTVDTASGLPTSILSDTNDSEGTFDLQLASSASIITGDEDNVIQTSNAGVTVNAGGGNDIITGGTGNDTLNGEGGNDTINGGDGNDTINGGLGSDIINAGAGNDTIVFDTADTSVDGGIGIDTLKLSGDVNFSGLGTLLSNIEKLDATVAGNQTISGLSLDKIFTMTDSSSSHTLTIDGNAGDAVSAVDKTGWTKTNETSDATYKSYEYHKGSDVVTLKVDLDMTNNTGLA